jgi:ribosomal protein S12 methylthiotransferase
MIVGFPQETELEFKELYEFAAKIKFERLGVFTYSAEENTTAALLKGQIPENIKNKRRDKIIRMQKKIVEHKNSSFVGKKMEVLIDKVLNPGLAIGRTQYDAPDVDGLVYVKGRDLKTGSFEKVNISKVEIPFMKGSENMNFKDWKKIAKVVQKLLNEKWKQYLIVNQESE